MQVLGSSSPELGDEVPGHVDQGTSTSQADQSPEDPDHTEDRCALDHQGLMRLESLVEVAHVIGAPHFQQDFSVLLHLVLPHLQVWLLMVTDTT